MKCVVQCAWFVMAVGLSDCGPAMFAQETRAGREVLLLDGEWDVQAGDGTDWVSVSVPDTFESQIAVDFDGIATFRTYIEPVAVESNKRLILQFGAVATHATVFLNDVQVGEHLGGWTPFRLDVTDAANSRGGGRWELRVVVDERVGHNTQGFLPIIAPHFGGIWQSVRLLTVPNAWIDDNTVLAVSDAKSQTLHLGFDWIGAEGIDAIELSVRRFGEIKWTPLRASELLAEQKSDGKTRFQVDGTFPSESGSLSSFKRWSPDSLSLYEVLIDVLNAEKTETLDSAVIRFACRDIRTDGDGFLLNDAPLNIRGILNWGYAPPRTAPGLDEAFMRNEIELARSSGFNLMKFCLWIPPKRYLELCDELGMLAWIEYPAWHPDFSPARLEELRNEYDEFFAHDRNHPSVILRSLTCETGPSADLGVIQALYDRCHEMVPGAIVVDDSSWIAWNRVHDFYDDHPYGNNHTWVEELTKLKAYIAERQTRPLMLGEAIAADTWTVPDWFADKDADEWHFPDSIDAARIWLDEARVMYGAKAVEHVLSDSKCYAMLMRKFQMETYRREVPKGGYVVSVVRDFPKAAMGLIDFRGERKWAEDDWTWHGNTMVLLKTESDRRSFASGSAVEWEITIATAQAETQKGHQLEFGIVSPEGTKLPVLPMLNETERSKGYSWFIKLALPQVNEPKRFTVFANLFDRRDNLVARNEWPIWVLPEHTADAIRVQLHTSAIEFRELLIDCGATIVESNSKNEPVERPPMVTRMIDEQVIHYMAGGGSVLMLPNNGPGSLPLESHWFLRGGPVLSDRPGLFGSDKTTGWLAPRELMVELQHFDLAGDVVRDIDYLDAIDPLFMLWETHDLNEVKTNGLLYRVPVGQSGELVVSALRHDGHGNQAGKFLLGRLLKGLSEQRLSTTEVIDGRGEANLARLREEVSARQWSIESMDWRFQPDAGQHGVAANWQAIDFDDSDWETIHADRHWESQGQETLDGWAWYRLAVDMPADWPEGATWLSFSGVDDYYDLYISGEKVGSAGNIEKRETAFDLRTSHDISKYVKAGRPLQISVAVYDWYGAGGIFRPVTLSTQPLSDKRRILK